MSQMTPFQKLHLPIELHVMETIWCLWHAKRGLGNFSIHNTRLALYQTCLHGEANKYEATDFLNRGSNFRQNYFPLVIDTWLVIVKCFSSFWLVFSLFIYETTFQSLYLDLQRKLFIHLSVMQTDMPLFTNEIFCYGKKKRHCSVSISEHIPCYYNNGISR